MKKTTKNLKYVIYSEWSYNPPAGSMTLYYDARGEKIGGISDPITDIYDHLSEFVFDEQADEFKKYCMKSRVTKNFIKSFSWSDGGVGCDCELYAEGRDIAGKAADFLMSRLDFEGNCDDEDYYNEKIKLVDYAKSHPDDYSAVNELLDLVAEAIEYRNDMMLRY